MTTQITRLLVANRAEIASRVFRTCRRLGIDCVAVHSDADAGLAHVAEADLAVRLPGVTPAETYLRGGAVVEAARAAGADAVHPGYGFLSESADFARAVLEAGLTWVGPSPESIELMGSKVRAKELMREAGVPVLPSWTGEEVAAGGARIETPLLVKASAGGGGRGMRVVRSLDDLEREVASARAEAESAFGDGTVFVEPYVERGRHVEVQVVGGPDGVAVLGTRDCSLQRRHQKVVEEAPAPGLGEGVERALLEAARDVAAAIDYRGAGTVEFLYDPDSERFFFLEMNTRLQVEHPVTEEVFGVDLVGMQLAVAQGLDPGVGTPAPRGHAIEVRLYAEDPAADHQPQSGLLTAFEIVAGEGVRVESGFRAGDEVTTHYDAMLAKVVVHGPTRDQAARRLADVLRRSRIHGVRTNRDQLVAALRHPAFLAGEVSTAFLAEHADELAAGDAPAHAGALGLFAVAVARAELRAGRRPRQRGIPAGWRNVVSQPHRLAVQGQLHGAAFDGVVAWHGPGGGRGAYTFVDARPGAEEGHGPTPASEVAAEVVDIDAGGEGPAVVTLSSAGVSARFTVAETLDVDGDGGRYDVDGPWGHLALRVPPRFVDPADVLIAGSLLAPMPGTVVKVLVAEGDEVEPGAPVLVLEAMKMQHTVAAPAGGTVSSLPVAAGAQVASGEVLAVVGAPASSQTETESPTETQEST